MFFYEFILENARIMWTRIVITYHETRDLSRSELHEI